MPSLGMNTLEMPDPLERAEGAAASTSKMLRSECLSRLRQLQNTDGGWPFAAGEQNRVEPTSFALLALREAKPQYSPANASRRRELAISLLYDRMCPGGGWNCGNPRVYGVDGDPLVLPTCWALLALRDAQEKPGRALSLA